MIPNDKHADALKASHADMVRHAREHYEFVSQLARGYSTSIPQAIDAWEREPDLLAALEAAEERAAAAEARVGRLEEALKTIMSLEASRPEVAGELIAYFRGIAHRALENLDPR